MTKNQLRIEYKSLRQNLSNEQLKLASNAIFENCLKLDIWDAKFCHVFKSIEKFNEIDTSRLISLLFERNKRVVVPVSNFSSNTMIHVEIIPETTFINNRYGIPEPEIKNVINEDMIDVVFVPLLCVDYAGNRVGYGKGFYDKFLKNCRPNTQFIGLSLFDVLPFLIEKNDTDIALYQTVTPTEIIDHYKNSVVS